jgi:hypothetical protein
MKRKHLLPSLLLGALVALSTGCVVHGHGRVHTGVHAHVSPVVVEVEEAPPPPRVVVVDTRPGFIWVEGRWHRHGGRWEWRDGHWERERAGHIWVQGRWEQRGRRHVWVDGHWRGGGGIDRRERQHDRRDGVIIRDHRGQGQQGGGGVIIRDHR